VFTRDVRFEGWTATDWTRFLALFRRESDDSTGDGGGLLAIHDGGRLRKLFHTRVGRVDPATTPWPQPLGDLAATHHASWVLSMQAGALDVVMDRFGARARPDDDLVAQGISLAQIVRDMAVEGRVESWPRRIRSLPLPSFPVYARTLDSLCPDGKLLLAGVFDEGELWTSIALRRRGSGFDWILGPDEVRRAMGLLSGDWRRDYRHLVRAVQAQMHGELAASFFAETRTLRGLVVDDSPGAWARAAAVREIIVAPLAGPAVIPLGVDALRGLVATMREVSNRLASRPVIHDFLAPRALPPDPFADDVQPTGHALLSLLRRLFLGS
jgi:hypothetical protein